MHADLRNELDHLIAMAAGLRDGRIKITSAADVNGWEAIVSGSIEMIADLLDEGLSVER